MKAEHKFASAITAAVLAVFGITIAAFLNGRDLVNSTALVTHSHDNLEKLGDLLRSIQGANTGAQEFFLTGEQGYLIPYRGGLEEIGQGIDDLRKATADEPGQQDNIDLLQVETNRHIAYLHQRVTARQTGGLNAVLPLAGPEGKDILDEIRFRAATIRNTELRLLKNREQLVREHFHKMLSLFALLLGATVAFLLSGWLFLQRYLAKRRRAESGWRTSERKLRGVLEVTSDAILITDEVGTIQHANSRAAKMFGYTLDEITSSSVKDLLQTLPAEVMSDGNRGPVSFGKRKDQTLFAIQSTEFPVDLEHARLLVRAIHDQSPVNK